MGEQKKVRIGISHGDINGVSYETILKIFDNPEMLDICTPVIYGSPKVATYYRKVLEMESGFSIIKTVREAEDGRVNMLNCVDEAVMVDMGRTNKEAGRSSLDALTRAVSDYMEGFLDVLVAAPVSDETMQSEEYTYADQSLYVSAQADNNIRPLDIFVNEDLRVGLATSFVPFTEITSLLNKEFIMDRIIMFHQALRDDFGIDSPRIAVMGLNPGAGEGGLTGNEEVEFIKSAVKEMADQGVLCFGPYPADELIGSGRFKSFDGVLAMYHDQGLLPFRTIVGNGGLRFTAGLPIVCTMPAHGPAYDIAGRGVADEKSMREAIYLGIDIYRRRILNSQCYANPLRKLYFDKRDDSYKLRLDEEREEI